ncbi:MFS transporter [Rhodococcus sp. BP-149]|uniref:MFS transporter n=5 Tax=Rhodococcus TaxID=1827 RepID=UPI001C9ABC64|nr:MULTISPECIES: MFS transporter [unclassified Rhodococcus (in: high G+C Gram-positive bacteria)]MBY6687456.1 MFS transporter [Rhodococcus sp. BP-288]MBY6700581.1 MFS transporter [Rhodococcus sp. BP-285]MBY6704396.1 MFS transporter [Rhodococcus sp. BP-283]MBY6713706.1 MFS transporter [Rhodococcus sp. BP-160]MBY6722263.1 MFS transporter [Rhodococcus sp. BP-142]
MASLDRVLLSRAQKWTLVVSCLSVALVVASMAALYTALPDIAVATGATQTQLTWVVDGYTLALGCLVLPAGALGDRYGRRAVLIVGLGLFSLASAVPLLVSTPWWLIAARAAAGVGAAFVMPSTLSILTAGFSEQQRGRAVGIWAGVAGSGGLLGILGSGVLLAYWPWQSIFVGLTWVGVFLLLCAFTLPESRQEYPPPIDVIGSVAVVFAIGLVVLAIIEVPARGWSDPVVLAGFGLGVVATAIFALWELRVDQPLLDVRFFARRGFGSGSFSVTIQFLVTFGIFLVLVQYLQLIFGYSPLGSALALAPMMVPLVLLSVVAPWMAARLGLRLMTVTGLLAIAAGFYFISRLALDSTYVDVLWPTLMMSAGLGLTAAPATAAIVADTAVEKHGVAAAVNDATREIGAAIGIAVAGSVLAAGYSRNIAPAMEVLPPEARGPVTDSLAGALEVADRAGPAGRQLADFAKSAFLHGTEQSAIVLALIAAAGAAILLFWAPGRAPGTPDTGASGTLNEPTRDSRFRARR